MGLKRWLVGWATQWLNKSIEVGGVPMSDFKRIGHELRPADVLLVEGHSRVSEVIKNITRSPWTHSALYIGRLHDIEDEAVRRQIEKYYFGSPGDQLIIEALLGEDTVVRPLNKYASEHLRICRPKAISFDDASRVVKYAAERLGTKYDLRQLLDLARFIFPYSILPRRWRSTLFEHNAGQQTRTVCSSMIAEAFSSVHFPILPVIQRSGQGQMHMYQRNSRLAKPCDFDYSPYFDIIKYPFMGFDELTYYRQLPWDQDGTICNDVGDCFTPSEADASHKNRAPIKKNSKKLDNNGVEGAK
ncbi:MAG: hypothetical protein L3J70_09240 [Gammaproteobacteria bacterium]|nr:hypothetical protein [Gammaproteobacteria bacterium]